MCDESKVHVTGSFEKSKEKVELASLHLFAAAYHVAKNDLSYSSFPAILELLMFAGCSSIPLDTYHNDKACAMFVNYMNETLFRSQLDRVKKSPFFSLMLDESTDIGNNQNLIIYVSFLEIYEPITMFLGLLELTSGTAQCLYNACIDFLSKHGLDIQKMICFGSHGASSMIGRHTGLSTRLKLDNPYMTSIHCIAHRASLCLADAVKQSDVANDIDVCMIAIAALVSKSSLRKTALEKLQEEFGCAVLTMSRIHKVRWLSRQIIVKKVCESYEALLEFTRKENNTLFEKISTFEFMYNVHFLCDVLDRLASLSKVFQKTYVDVTSIVGIIETEISALEMYFLDDPVIDVNASIQDRLEFPIVPEYGPPHGQLYALRNSICGAVYRSICIGRKQDGSDLNNALQF